MANRQFGVENWTLLQDNARSHASIETLTVLKELSVDVLPDFLLYNPDLNIYEVAWAIMEKELKCVNLKPWTNWYMSLKSMGSFDLANNQWIVNGFRDRLVKVNGNPG